jgi:hypothetical protein
MVGAVEVTGRPTIRGGAQVSEQIGRGVLSVTPSERAVAKPAAAIARVVAKRQGARADARRPGGLMATAEGDAVPRASAVTVFIARPRLRGHGGRGV